MKKWLCRFLGRSERGASLVEFALVVPVLLALVMGIIEFGWLFNGWITITGSAREGARLAAVGKDYNEIMEAVEKHTSTFENVYVDPESIFGEEEVSVYVTGDIRPLVGFFVGGEFVTLNAEATMRSE